MKSGDKTGVGDIDLPMPRSSSKRTRGQVDNQTGHEESANEDDQTGCWAQETRGDGDGLDKALLALPRRTCPCSWHVTPKLQYLVASTPEY